MKAAVSTETDLARRRLSRFLEDATRDLDALVRLGDEIKDVVQGHDAGLPDRAKAAILAVALHGYASRSTLASSKATGPPCSTPIRRCAPVFKPFSTTPTACGRPSTHVVSPG